MNHHPPSPWVLDGPVPFRIRGEDIQTVEFLLRPGTRIIAQPDTFVCGAGGLTGLQITWGRRLMDPFVRKWSGEASVLQEIVSEETPARVILGAPQIGKIVRLRVTPDRSIICQRGAFLASTGNVDINIAFTRRIRAGLFGGQGAVFQRLSGHGDVFLHALGNVIDWTLPPGNVIRAHTHDLLAFEDTVGYDVQIAGGLLTVLFGSQGMFLLKLEGPGRVLVQSINHDAFYRHATRRAKLLRRGRGAGIPAVAPPTDNT